MWSGGCLNNICASHASCASWLPDSLSCLQLENMWATFPHSSSLVSIFFLFLIFNLQRCEFPLDELLIGHRLFFPWILSVSFKGMIYWGQKVVSYHLHVASFPLFLSCSPQGQCFKVSTLTQKPVTTMSGPPFGFSAPQLSQS